MIFIIRGLPGDETQGLKLELPGDSIDTIKIIKTYTPLSLSATYQKITPLSKSKEPNNYSVTVYIGEQAPTTPPRPRCHSFIATPVGAREMVGEQNQGASPSQKNKSVFRKFFGKKDWIFKKWGQWTVLWWLWLRILTGPRGSASGLVISSLPRGQKLKKRGSALLSEILISLFTRKEVRWWTGRETTSTFIRFCGRMLCNFNYYEVFLCSGSIPPFFDTIR